ncbi:MAG: GGDEF domain-containing protein [Fibrobacter sp.]|jgi:diguanylate cyclase (GGDEF)-like protein|uniref:GGDEF domain-containing protein n=1 Tax=Fibrobacter sp. UWB7 TaxID=1896206 RepID=UPI000922CA59|nr:GGDEF domain-containing protein [Fibrobacter sp. UWB7]MBQ3779264.1 GGDEF domain-containing protein [Fibrobacter sp.]SHM19416.1 diguanylate cyclase (GGDEF) domain-containing protein [Fibrobacter sp. UWB7]
MSYIGLIEINIICIAVLIITLLQFKDSILRHLEERILGFTIIDTIIYIVLSTVTKMLYSVHVQSDLYTSNQKICVIYAVMYALSLSSSLLLAQLWFSFIFLRIRKSVYSYKHLFPLFSTPSIIGIFICIGISIYGFTNDCHTTSLQFRRLLPFLIGLNFIYIIATMVLGIQHAIAQRNSTNRKEAFYLSFIALVPSGSCIIQYFVPNIPLTDPIFALTLLHVYVTLLKYRITSDPLTGVNNKIRLIDYLQYITQHQDSSKRLFILVMEVDFFKDIIRNFGYEMSDRVIADLASFFKRQCRGQNAFLARTGDNQFAIVMERDEVSEIESFCQKLVRECDRDSMQSDMMTTWKISFSLHYAEISNISTSNISQIFAEAKKNCYKPETPAPKD